MSNKSVVRNAQYKRNSLNIRQRHNERQNTGYMNDDIIKERAEHNVHFKKPDGTYEQMFDDMLNNKIINTRGLRKDPFIVDELVFDVNTSYFENHGGYEYAKSFFKEAYQCAINEIGGEQFILSAVMHADERNKALSEQYGYDVYHYHLHVVYVPVVDKQLYYSKNHKDRNLAGKSSEIIKQVSHSKKWPKLKQYDKNGEVVRNGKGKAVLLNSYSVLQDKFHDHMKNAGFTGFERGERNSTAEHLSILEFKTKKESERAKIETQQLELLKEKSKLEKQTIATMTEITDQKKILEGKLNQIIETQDSFITELNQRVTQKTEILHNIDKKTAIVKQEAVMFNEIDRMGDKKTISGNITISQNDFTVLSQLAKEGIRSRSIISEFKEKVSSLLRRITGLEKKLELYEGKDISIELKLHQALKRAPRRLTEVIVDILRKPPERAIQNPEKPINHYKHVSR